MSGVVRCFSSWLAVGVLLAGVSASLQRPNVIIMLMDDVSGSLKLYILLRHVWGKMGWCICLSAPSTSRIVSEGPARSILTAPLVFTENGGRFHSIDLNIWLHQGMPGLSVAAWGCSGGCGCGVLFVGIKFELWLIFCELVSVSEGIGSFCCSREKHKNIRKRRSCKKSLGLSFVAVPVCTCIYLYR